MVTCDERHLAVQLNEEVDSGCIVAAVVWADLRIVIAIKTGAPAAIVKVAEPLFRGTANPAFHFPGPAPAARRIVESFRTGGRALSGVLPVRKPTYFAGMVID
jgi:hypothetical protein